MTAMSVMIAMSAMGLHCGGGGTEVPNGDAAVGDVVRDSGPSEQIPLGPGIYTLRVGARTFILQIPNGYSAATPSPLMVVLHAFGESASIALSASGFREQAESNTYVAVYPEGNVDPSIQGGSFNGFHCCGPARAQSINDVMFVQTIVTRVQQTLNINSAKVYAVGYDNGGMLAHRLAVEAPTTFAAIAALGASVTGRPSAEMPVVTPPMPSEPVSVLIVHGRIDTQVPYMGGMGLANAVHGSVEDSVRFWTEANHCASNAELTVLSAGLVQNTQRGCRANHELTSLSAVEGIHSWRVLEPHGTNTAQTVMAFFARNSR